ncbi:hypothetical protein B296_00057014, partial [Ensete ventricosum]
MPKREYERLREEERAWGRLQRPLVTSAAAAVGFAVLVAVIVNLSIVFPREASQRPFCRDWKVLQALQLNVSQESELHRYRGAFYLTDQEAVDYYWMVVFVPSAVVFVISVAYLVAGEQCINRYLKSRLAILNGTTHTGAVHTGPLAD